MRSLLIGILVGWPLLAGGQNPATPEPQGWNVTAAEAARKNPVKPDEESWQEGKTLYASQCAMCHGEKGDGQGEVGRMLSSKVADLSAPKTLREISDGALFAMVTRGLREMPGLENRLSDSQKWHVINYLRTLSGSASGNRQAGRQDPAASREENKAAPAPKD